MINENKIYIVIIIILLFFLLFNRKDKIYIKGDTIVQHDTVTMIDTQYYPKPIPKIVRVTDTLYLSTDSIKTEGDSIMLPIESKIYSDSTYKLQVSGYRPNLDYINIFPQTKYIYETKTIEHTPRITHGFQFGVGLGIISKKPDIFVGYGLSIRLNK